MRGIVTLLRSLLPFKIGLDLKPQTGWHIGPIQSGKVMGNILSLSVGSAISQALMATSFLLMSRHLGPKGLGQFASSFSAASLSAILLNWGLDTWLLQSTARHDNRIGSLLVNAMSLKMGLGLLWLSALVTILPRLNPDTFAFPLVLATTLAVWAESILNLVLTAFKALLKNTDTALILIASRGLILLSTVLLIILDIHTPSAFALIRLTSAVGFGLTALARLPFRLGRVRCRVMQRALVESSAFAVSDLFASIYARADMVIAAAVLTADDVGMYAPATQVISALFVFPSAWYFVAVPVLTRMNEEEGGIGSRDIVLTILSFAAIGAVLWLGTWTVSNLALESLLGSSFSGSSPLLSILSPVTFLKSCSFGLAAILVSIGWQRRRVFIQISIAIINSVLNLALVKRFGISSVAAVYVVSEIALMLGYLTLVTFWIRRSQVSGEASAHT